MCFADGHVLLPSNIPSHLYIPRPLSHGRCWVSQLVKGYPLQVTQKGGGLLLIHLAMSMWEQYPCDPAVVEVSRTKKEGQGWDGMGVQSRVGRVACLMFGGTGR